MALSPFVFIGVGGSGGKTLRVIHQVLQDTLTTIGWQGAWPQAWQFLHIEVAAAPDGIEPGLPFTLPLKDFLPLTTPQSTYRAVDRQVSNTQRQGLDHHLAFDSWRPFPPESTGVTISLGAGQYRAVGRVAVLNSLADVGAGVSRVLKDAGSADVAELKSIQALWGSENLGTDNITREPVVMVIASLSGGSGSGALLDVCDVVRSFRTGEQSKVTAVVYSPDIFEREDGSLEPGIAPNTFVALNELMNASWVRSTQDLPLSREVLFSRSSINPHHDQTGPDLTYLVGRRNASVTLGTTSEIYRVTGRSLAELALNESQQDKIGAYAIANADNRAGDVDHTVPLAPRVRDVVTQTHTNLYALGFARLSVGRDIFREYAAQRLAREAVLRLQDGHRSRRQPGDRRTDEALAEEFAEQRWPAFLRESHLNEVGYDANAVIEAILPPGELEDLLAEWARSVQGKLDSGSSGGQLPIEDAREQVRDEVDQALKVDGIFPRYLAQLKERAIMWRRGVDGDDSTSIHRVLGDLVISEAAIAGLQVADRLVERLARDLAKAVDELEVEGRQRSQDGNDLLQALLSRKPNEPRKVETEVGGYVDQTLIGAEGYDAIYQLFYSEAVGMAAAVLKDLSTKLLAPIRRGLRDASDLLKQEVSPASGRASDFTYWPGKSDIPEHLLPGRVERTLDVIEEFPEVFLDLVARSTGADSGNQGLALAVEDLIRGAKLAPQLHAPEPYLYRGRWVPDQERIRHLDERPSTAVVEFQIGLHDLLERARAWVSHDEKAIGRHIQQSMSSYLTDSDVGTAERAQRRARLTGEFAEMLRLSQPLIKIDTNLYQLAHGDDEPPVEVVMSPLDIPQDDRELIAELRDIAQGILHREIIIPIGAQRGGTQVMTRLTAPVHPVAVQSIMEPIYTQWASDHLGRNFWSFRRARPLTEWVPMSPVARAALAEGWVTARLLGLAHVAQDHETKHWQIRVKSRGASGRGASWVTLGDSGPRTISRDDALGNLLELVAMTTLDVYRVKNLSPLEPFQTLVDLGSASWDSSALRSWVLDGDGLDETGDPVLKNAADPAARRAELLAGLSAMEARFATYARLLASKTIAELQRAPRVEISRLGIAAVQAIRIKLSGDDDLEQQEGAA